VQSQHRIGGGAGKKVKKSSKKRGRPINKGKFSYCISRGSNLLYERFFTGEELQGGKQEEPKTPEKTKSNTQD